MITEKDIEKIATLAKLEVRPEEMQRYISDLENILAFAEEIDCFDESTSQNTIPLDYSSMREDMVKASLDIADIISNAFDSKDAFFRLRKRV